LRKLVDQSIDDFVNGKNSNDMLLLGLYEALESWEQQTAAKHINGLFTRHFKNTLERKLSQTKGLYAVPLEFSQHAKNLLPGGTKQLPINPQLANYNYDKLEKFIHTYFEEQIKKIKDTHQKTVRLDALNEKLISGFRVIFVDNQYLPKVGNKFVASQMGLRKTIFVPDSFLKLGRAQLADHIASVFTDIELGAYEEITPLEKNKDIFKNVVITNIPATPIVKSGLIFDKVVPYFKKCFQGWNLDSYSDALSMGYLKCDPICKL
jgi:hypothetical protein